MIRIGADRLSHTHCVARACARSVPMLKASAPTAPCVVVCESIVRGEVARFMLCAAPSPAWSRVEQRSLVSEDVADLAVHCLRLRVRCDLENVPRPLERNDELAGDASIGKHENPVGQADRFV